MAVSHGTLGLLIQRFCLRQRWPCSLRATFCEKTSDSDTLFFLSAVLCEILTVLEPIMKSAISFREERLVKSMDLKVHEYNLELPEGVFMTAWSTEGGVNQEDRQGARNGAGVTMDIPTMTPTVGRQQAIF